MSTSAKIGKSWVKCQVILQETGETLHLTFAPGQTKKSVVVHVDGRTDTGTIELVALPNAAAPYDAALQLTLKGEGVRAKTVAPKPDSKPKVTAPTPAPAPSAPPPRVEGPAAPTPVASDVEKLPAPPEEIVVSEVQEPAADTTPAAGGKRGRKPAIQLPE